MQQRPLGKGGTHVSALGLGCFSMAHAYGLTDAHEAAATLRRALDAGCTFIDTAASYGAGQNEELLAQALGERRGEAFLATKIGFTWDREGTVVARNGRPEHLRSACEASLQRLRTTHLDLLYLHRVDPQVPVEESVGALSALVAEGKVRFLGLSELSASLLRRAHAVHPIAALQSEYSLWARAPEQEILPLCQTLGIGFVAFAPLGRGAFRRQLWQAPLPQNDFRRSLPRFQSERQRHLQLADDLEAFAQQAGCSAAQMALAWVLSAPQRPIALAGTSKRKHLEDNLGALNITISPERRAELSTVFSPANADAQRYPETSLFKPD